MLQDLVQWKKQSIDIDIKHKRRLVPREHWVVNTDAITPQGFQGTTDQKLSKAEKKVQDLLEGIKNVVDSPQPDQSVITSNMVEGRIVEPKTTSYKDANETIKQINSFLGTPFGAPESFLGGEVRGFAGTTMSALFSTMRIDVICAMIAEELEKVIRNHVGILFPQHVETIIPRLKIRVNSTLDQVMLEKSKIAMNMASLSLFSRREIRGIMGYSGVAQNPFSRSMNGTELRDSDEQLEADAENTGDEDQLNNRSPSGRRGEQLGAQSQ